MSNKTEAALHGRTLQDELRAAAPHSDDYSLLVRAASALDGAKPERVNDIIELALLPTGVVVRSDAGTIAARFDAERGVVFGVDGAFPWGLLELPATVLWRPQP